MPNVNCLHVTFSESNNYLDMHTMYMYYVDSETTSVPRTITGCDRCVSTAVVHVQLYVHIYNACTCTYDVIFSHVHTVSMHMYVHVHDTQLSIQKYMTNTCDNTLLL